VSGLTQVPTILWDVTDRFSKSLELRYPPEDLWWAIEWWRATVASRFIAAGGEGRTSQITAWWEEGGYSDRKTAEELREFAKKEHLTPNYMNCTMRNATYLEATVEVEFWARFYRDGEFSLKIEGDIKQQVFGLHAELLLDKEAEEARIAQAASDAAKRDEEARVAAETAPAAAAAPTAAALPASKSAGNRFAAVVAVGAGIAAILTFIAKATGVF
jgi:hypothetical protein